MKEIFAEKMKNNPIIAGVKDEKNLEDALNSDCEIIFLLCGSIFNLKDIVKKEDIPALAVAAFNDVCTGGNPRPTSVEDIAKLYEFAYE